MEDHANAGHVIALTSQPMYCVTCDEGRPVNTPEQRYDAEDFRSGDAFLAGFDMDKAIDALMGEEWGL